MSLWNVALLAVTLSLLKAEATTVQYFVSGIDGNDSNSGTTPDMPFRTLSKCLNATFAVGPETDAECVVQNGTYRESIDLDLLPGCGDGFRKLKSAEGAKVVFSGLKLLPASLDWVSYGNNSQCIWQANVSTLSGIIDASTRQLFYNGKMMVQAQYPNFDIGGSLSIQALTPSVSWVHVDPRSRYGTIIDSGLKQFPEGSLNGVRATLNVAHQFFTWTRKISNFSSVNGSFNYPKNLPSLGQWLYEPGWWGTNQFFLSGSKVLLDTAGEWVFDEESQSLLFWPPPSSLTVRTCTPPMSQSIQVKVSDYVLQQGMESTQLKALIANKKISLDQARFERAQSGAAALSNFHIDGIDVVGAAIALNKCDNCRLTNVRFVYPSFDQDVPETYAANPSDAAHAVVSGNGNYVENVTVAFTNNQGFSMGGSNGTMSNSLFGYTDWLGTLSYKPVSVYGINLTVTRTTAYAFGNAGITTYVPGKGNHSWKGTVQVG